MVSKRPDDVDPATWRKQRDRVWRRRNMVLNVLMLLAIALVLWRYCGS